MSNRKSKQRKRKARRLYTEQDDAILCNWADTHHLLGKLGETVWKMAAQNSLLPGCSFYQMRNRYRYHSRHKNKKGNIVSFRVNYRSKFQQHDLFSRSSLKILLLLLLVFMQDLYSYNLCKHVKTCHDKTM